MRRGMYVQREMRWLRREKIFFSLIVRNQEVCVCMLIHSHLCCVLYVYERSVMIDWQAAPAGLRHLWPLTLKSPVWFNDPVLSHPSRNMLPWKHSLLPPLIMQESLPSVSNSVSSQVGDLWRDVCSLISISTDALLVSQKLLSGFQVKYYS